MKLKVPRKVYPSDAKKNEYSKRYRTKNKLTVRQNARKHYQKVAKETPWVGRYHAITQRCKTHPTYNGQNGYKINNLLTMEEIKNIWFRDKAYEMKKPSIDRIDSTGDYVFNNCRFIELTENRSRPQRKRLIKKPINRRLIQLMIDKNSKPVIQMDLQGNFIKQWKSRSEAARSLGIGKFGVIACANGDLKKSAGFTWKNVEPKSIIESLPEIMSVRKGV